MYMNKYLEKQLAYLILALWGSLVQWSELPQINRIDIGIVLYEQFSDLIVAVGASIV